MLRANEVHVQQLGRRAKVVQAQIDRLLAKLPDGANPEISGLLSQAARWLNKIETQCIATLQQDRDPPRSAAEELAILESAEVPLNIALSLLVKIKNSMH